LRAKEFLSQNGIDFESINIHNNPEGQARLKAHGLSTLPVVCVGDNCVPGGDLKAVAGLIGFEYTPRAMLTPSELFGKFTLIIESACRYVQQFPYEALSMSSPDRDRSVRNLGLHIMQIPGCFLTGYDTGVLRLGRITLPDGRPIDNLTGAEIALEGERVLHELTAWWRRAGFEDPMDRVIDTYWGTKTVHEAMERETWHSGQHTRQVMMFLDKLEIPPEGRLTADDFDGLPMPKEVWG
jgi:hypothetical protein